MSDEPSALGRRRAITGLAAAGGAFAYLSSASGAAAEFPDRRNDRRTCWYDVKLDFHATGDGVADDSSALQSAINAGSEAQRPVSVPTGVYRITRPLSVPSNTMLYGSNLGLGFGCRIEPEGCTAFVVGGKIPSFHCAIENLMIWPKGPAPETIMTIDNSYSIAFRNIRIHEAQPRLRRAAVLLLGDSSSGGHGGCNDILWDNLIVRNDGDQPPVAVLASKGCGSHRFFSPTLENYVVLLEWQGGALDLMTPYTERAGRYAVNCNLDAQDDSAYLNTFGGVIDSAASGIGCAIRSTTRNFNSFATRWGPTGIAAYAYDVPEHYVNFLGTVPNLRKSGKSRFDGVAGWRRMVRFPEHEMSASKPARFDIPARGMVTTDIEIPGVNVGEASARVAVDVDSQGLHLSAFVKAMDTVTVNARNPTDARISLDGTLFVECRAT